MKEFVLFYTILFFIVEIYCFKVVSLLDIIGKRLIIKIFAFVFDYRNYLDPADLANINMSMTDIWDEKLIRLFENLHYCKTFNPPKQAYVGIQNAVRKWNYVVTQYMRQQHDACTAYSTKH